MFKSAGENVKTVIVRTSHCPIDLLFFTRFTYSYLARMGKEVKSDLAVDPIILHLILRSLNNKRMNDGTSITRKRYICVV